LLAEVCTGQLGAVFCIAASRLAHTGQDWHHLIELCGLVTFQRKNEQLSPFDSVAAATGFCKNVQKSSPRHNRRQQGSALSLQNIFRG
jgi:hypothetical protein